MRLKLTDVVLEQGDYWVLRVSHGFDVYRTGVTHSTRCAQIGFQGDEGMKRARAEIERRQLLDAGRK